MPDNEIIIRVGAFSFALVCLLLWEHFAPRRVTLDGHWIRRVNNLALVLVTILIVQLLLPVLALVGIADAVAKHDWGLFNNVDLPGPVVIVLSILILDFTIYWQHRLFHAWQPLWRLHQVHHSDKEFDVTTGIRFHPFELIISLCLKAAVVILIGAPALAVLIFELILNLLPMFNHSNVKLPLALDRYLRLVVVTPDMHRVHHSQIREETDSNFCFSVPWWDRLFHTYRDQPREGHPQMHIGLKQFTNSDTIHLSELLLLPFRRSPE